MFESTPPPYRGSDDKAALGLVVGVASFWLLFAFAWAISGLVAFVWSLVCFGRSGSGLDKAIGLLIAMFLGPIFFLYLTFNKPYCR